MAEKLLKATTTVSSMTLLSRIVGFVRDMVIAQIFGASASLDAFLLAFKIPNFMRRLFAEGAFSQAFVPVLSEYKTQHSLSEVQLFTSKVFCCLLVVLLVLTFLGVMGAPVLIHLFAPGFAPEGERFHLATHLLQLTFPYILLISITAFAAGVQNAYGKFAIPAFTPVLLNFSLIGAALWIAPYCADPVEGLAWGVLIAGAVQLLFQIPFMKKLALMPHLVWDWRDPGVRRILGLMVPALIGGSVMQVNLLVDTIFASFLPVGSLTWLYYSDRLLEFPIGVLGVALATVVLPHLSHKYAQQNHDEFSASIDWALRWILLIGLPATVGLMMMSGPVLATLFQYGRFLPYDVVMASKSLMTLTLGLTCFLAVKILVSAFYARQNTRFPVKVAVVAMLANIVLNALLIGPLAHAGLALASSLASILNVGILLFALLRQKIYIPMPGWRNFGLRILFSNSAMAFVLWWFNAPMSQWLTWGAFDRVLTLGILMASAMATYFAGLWLTGLRYAHMRLENA